MDKRFTHFILISMLILWATLTYMERTQPKKAPAPGQPAQTTGTLTAATPQRAEFQPGPQPAPAPTPGVSLPPVETVKFKTKAYEIEFSPRGGVPVRWDIVDPRFVVAPLNEDGTTSAGAPMREPLMDPYLEKVPGGALPFQLVLREGNTRNFHPEVNQEVYDHAPVAHDGMTGIRFTSKPFATGLQVTKTYLFKPDGFMGRFTVEVRNVSQSTYAFDSGMGGLGITMGPGLGAPDRINRWAIVDVVLKSGSRFYYEHLGKPGPGTDYDHELTWGGLQSLYFMGVLIPEAGAPFTGAQSQLPSDLVPTVTSETYVSQFPQVDLYSARFEIAPGQSRTFNYEFYFGPKQAKILDEANHELKRVLFHDSYNWFRAIVLALMWCLDKFRLLTGSWGWAIILLTIFVRIVAFPLVHKGMKAQAVMMEQQKKLKPYLDKINEKFKDDPQRKQQEVFKLYKEHNINPLGMFKGCIWLFIQIPIFVALYKLLTQDIDLRGQAFMWFSDLTQPDRIMMLPFTIPFLGNALNLLPIITAVTQVLTSKYTQTSVPTDENQAAMQKMMIWMMPIMILGFTYSFPSGLMLYWLVSNIWQVLQQLWVNKHIHGPKKSVPPATAGAKGK